MNTPTQSNNDALNLIRSLKAGKAMDVTLACGKPHRFEPNDLLRNQEAILLFIGIEQVLASCVHNLEVRKGNVKLSAELGLSPEITPSLAELLPVANLPAELLDSLYSLKRLRNMVFHGRAPLFVKGKVERIRKVYAKLIIHTGHKPSQAILDAIQCAKTNLGIRGAVRTQSNYALLSDLLDVVDVERCLRDYLAECGVNARDINTSESVHALLNEKAVKSQKFPRGLHNNLLKVLILRNHLAHGMMLGLKSDHRVLVKNTAIQMHAVISGSQLAKVGGSMTLGEGFANGFAALGIVSALS